MPLILAKLSVPASQPSSRAPGMVILGSIVELILAVVLAAVFLNVGAVKLERMEWQY